MADVAAGRAEGRRTWRSGLERADRRDRSHRRGRSYWPNRGDRRHGGQWRDGADGAEQWNGDLGYEQG